MTLSAQSAVTLLLIGAGMCLLSMFAAEGMSLHQIYDTPMIMMFLWLLISFGWQAYNRWIRKPDPEVTITWHTLPHTLQKPLQVIPQDRLQHTPYVHTHAPQIRTPQPYMAGGLLDQ